MSRRYAGRLGGFSLLEALVALSILALSYGMILQLLGGSSRNATRASDYRQAIMIAESQLDMAAAARDPAMLPRNGEVGDKFAWSLDIARAPQFTMSDAASLYVPLQVTVQVSWDADTRNPARITMSTVRIGTGNLR